MSSVRSYITLGILIALLLACAGCTQTDAGDSCNGKAGEVCPVTIPSGSPAVAATSSMDSWKKVRLETDKGTITIALDPEMPVTAGNFETLVKQGYYDGIIFHRVINGFMIQGGDPTGTGRGGPGYTIKDEYTSHNRNSRGAVAMANTGSPNSGGSQFFINLNDNSARLENTFDSRYPVFGNVVEGMDVVDAIGKTGTTGYPTDRPLQNITIIRAVMV